MEITPVSSPELEMVWRAAADSLLDTPHHGPAAGFETIAEQYMDLVTCRDEAEQIRLLRRFSEEGLECKALLT